MSSHIDNGKRFFGEKLNNFSRGSFVISSNWKIIIAKDSLYMKRTWCFILFSNIVNFIVNIPLKHCLRYDF